MSLIAPVRPDWLTTGRHRAEPDGTGDEPRTAGRPRHRVLSRDPYGDEED